MNRSWRPALLIEAFAAAPHQGNGAAVVQLDCPAEAAWMQAVAGSLQQSETAFLWRQADGGWLLRWFTPSCEVELCGHATLATALALEHWQLLKPGEPVDLATRSGALQVRLDPDREGVASLQLPAADLQPLSAPAYLQPLLGQAPLAYWGSALGYRVALIDHNVDLAALPSPSSHLQGPDRMGLVVMQACNDRDAPPVVLNVQCTYQLRFFAPGLGLEEDPVTGSAHALVAPWWMQQRGCTSVAGWQPSSRRGGMLCDQTPSGQVRLSGTGHLLWDGQINATGCGHDPVGWLVCRR